MAVTASTVAAGAISGVSAVLSDAALASTKPSLNAASGNVVIGVFPEASLISCGAGTGTMEISGTAPGTLGVTWTACKDGPYTVNGGATITIPTTRTCTEDTDEANPNHAVPNSMTATVNAGTTVDIDGQVVTLANFGVVITNPVYDGFPDPPYAGDPTGDGGTCGIVAGDVVATGQISTAFEGETTTVDLGSSSLNVGFVANDTGVQVTISGSITVDTICTGDPFLLIISTSEPLVFPDVGDGSPTDGTLIVNDVPVDVVTTSAIPCSGFL
jgi:hypothetical protein